MIVEARTEAEKAEVVDYLGAKLGAPAEVLVGAMPYDAFAVIRGGRAIGALVLTNFRKTSIEFILAGDAGWLSRRDIGAVFRHVFDTLGVLRAWGCVAADNTAAREMAQRMGCRQVGQLDHEYGQDRHGILFSMTRDACPWIGETDGGSARG